MAVIASIDGTARRIYLHVDTVGIDVHPIDIYTAMRTFRRTDEDLRKYELFLSGHGKDQKSAGKFTERFVKTLLGTKIVPYDTTQRLSITGTIITDDGQEGIDCFDRSSLSPGVEVDIDYQPPQVEVIEVETGSGVSDQDKVDIINGVQNYDLTGYVAHSTQAGTQVRIAYNDIVEMDIVGGFAGTTFPLGMPGHEVNNFADAKTLLETYHLSKIRVNDDIVLPAGANLNGITFISGKTIDRTLTIPDTASTNGTKCRDIILTGTVNGRMELDYCQTEDLYNFSGIMSRTAVIGDLGLDDSQGSLTTMDDCRTGGDGSIPNLYINGAKLSIVDWSGSLNLHNKTGTSILGISTSAGNFLVKATCLLGRIIFAGTGSVQIETGATSIVIDTLVNKENISKQTLATTVEGALSLESVLRLILSATTGDSEGAGTESFKYKSVNGAKSRIISSFDEDGNRQITLLDAS